MEIKLIEGDITQLKADAIVNAANSSLMGGGGVDGAIHRAGGPAILEACKEIRARQGKCPTGEAVLTTAGALPARYVIHTVGPVWQGGGSDEPEYLRRCYHNSLELAAEHGVSSIAFPNISTGVYGYPKDKAAAVALQAIRSYGAAHPGSSVQVVLLVCFDQENYEHYARLLSAEP